MPSSWPPQPPPATPRTRRRHKKALPLPLKAFHFWQPPPGRDWRELPLDLISHVFHMLSPVELLLGGAAGVCRSWRSAARDEPELWRHIDMRGYISPCSRQHVRLHALARAAVRRSAGQCEAFWADFGDDDILLFLGEQAPLLKSLRLISCHKISSDVFTAVIKKFPLLEELELSRCPYVGGKEVFEAVARACPQLKHFRHIKRSFYGGTGLYYNDGEALAIAGMHELRSLELKHDRLTNEGLTAILDNCPRLELLVIRKCTNVTVDDALRAKCARVEIVRLRGDDYEYYKASRPAGGRLCSTCALSYATCYMDDDYLGDGFFVEDLVDCYDPSRHLDGVYVTDLDDDEDGRMLPKSVRRYLKME